MNKDNRDNQISPELKQLLDSLKEQDTFQTPTDYFGHQQEQILAQLSNETGSEDADFLSRQQEEILSEIKITNAEMGKDEFLIPDNFFKEQEKYIYRKTNKKSTGRIVPISRFIMRSAAVAAVIIITFFVVNKPSSTVDDKGFAYLLQKTSITEDDLLSIVSDEEYDELLFVETEREDYNDFILTDMDEFILLEEQEKLYDKNSLTQNTVDEIKPMDESIALIWESLSDEDIIEYIVESEEDWFNEIF